MSTTKAAPALPAIVVIVIIIALVTVGIWHLTSSSATKNVAEKQKVKAEKIAAEKYAATHPPAPVTNTGGKHKTLLVFLPDGCVTKYLSGNWERYPKGGRIKFIDSWGKTVLIDDPGTYVPSSLPAGKYQICRVSPNAWGVEIWE